MPTPSGASGFWGRLTGIEITVVSYKGTGQLTTDLAGGHVALGFNTITPAISNIEAGRLRVIAVAAPSRSAALPDVPTAAESGLPGFDAVLYYGLSAPTRKPCAIIDRLNKEVRLIVTSEEIKKRIVADGGDPVASAVLHRGRSTAHEPSQPVVVSSYHDRTGHRFCDRRAGTSRPLFWRRQRSRSGGRAHSAERALHHTAAARN
jgi:Tripartite tricarboxylate transporter family receptor